MSNNNSRSGSGNSNDTRNNDSPSDFLRKDNAGLVRLLKIMEETGGKDGISTRKLCEQTFNSRNYGMHVIKRAYDEGYIKRFDKSKRGHKKVNYLSAKAKRLSQLCVLLRFILLILLLMYLPSFPFDRQKPIIRYMMVVL